MRAPFADSLKRCKSCLLPETHETLVLNESGICNVCSDNSVKNKIDWESRLSDLDQLVSEYRGRYKYDCIVPFSGGKIVRGLCLS